ncbi:MAG: hypothetical protein DRP84_06970 [Spirochaetes bacterium]|nr:MAG: hypothetical protein DRP84_06970 [Spirochaetota bacterium]
MGMIHYVGMDIYKETIDLVVYRGNEQEVFLALKILLFIFICYAIIVPYKHNIYNTPITRYPIRVYQSDQSS